MMQLRANFLFQGKNKINLFYFSLKKYLLLILRIFFYGYLYFVHMIFE